ncbi:hypothetical protein [Candidatus Epulonipiscium viviparus]|nr:hypothetical protein [Candidatus Epulopiscium viviparus]
MNLLTRSDVTHRLTHIKDAESAHAIENDASANAVRSDSSANVISSD